MIYFIQNARSKSIKIGLSEDLGERLRTHQTSNDAPLKVIGAIEGGHVEEAELHRRYADRRIRGEWFRSDPAFLRSLKELCKRGLELNVWEECRLRNRCRNGLIDISMRHTPTGREFVCVGSEWGANSSLLVYATEGWYEPGTLPRYDDLGCLRLSDLPDHGYHPPEKLHAAECVLLSPWPVVCCPRRKR